MNQRYLDYVIAKYDHKKPQHKPLFWSTGDVFVTDVSHAIHYAILPKYALESVCRKFPAENLVVFYKWGEPECKMYILKEDYCNYT